MPIYMCLHRKVQGHRVQAVAEAHNEDRHGMKCHRHWYYEESGTLLCHTEAPSLEDVEAVHREAREPAATISEVNIH